jgi:hypothetical protein
MPSNIPPVTPGTVQHGQQPAAARGPEHDSARRPATPTEGPGGHGKLYNKNPGWIRSLVNLFVGNGEKRSQADGPRQEQPGTRRPSVLQRKTQRPPAAPSESSPAAAGGLQRQQTGLAGPVDPRDLVNDIDQLQNSIHNLIHNLRRPRAAGKPASDEKRRLQEALNGLQAHSMTYSKQLGGEAYGVPVARADLDFLASYAFGALQAAKSVFPDMQRNPPRKKTPLDDLPLHVDRLTPSEKKSFEEDLAIVRNFLQGKEGPIAPDFGTLWEAASRLGTSALAAKGALNYLSQLKLGDDPVQLKRERKSIDQFVSALNDAVEGATTREPPAPRTMTPEARAVRVENVQQVVREAAYNPGSGKAGDVAKRIVDAVLNHHPEAAESETNIAIVSTTSQQPPGPETPQPAFVTWRDEEGSARVDRDGIDVEDLYGATPPSSERGAKTKSQEAAGTSPAVLAGPTPNTPEQSFDMPSQDRTEAWVLSNASAANRDVDVDVDENEVPASGQHPDAGPLTPYAAPRISGISVETSVPTTPEQRSATTSPDDDDHGSDFTEYWDAPDAKP